MAGSLSLVVFLKDTLYQSDCPAKVITSWMLLLDPPHLPFARSLPLIARQPTGYLVERCIRTGKCCYRLAN